MRFPHGKIPTDILEGVVFRNLGVNRSEVTLGPSAGIDGAVIDVGNLSLIVSMDPITGSSKKIGWLAVNVNANDVATFGVEPAFLFSCLLLPESSTRKTIAGICAEMDKATRGLGIAIAGGHCEVTPGLTRPIVVGCAMGITERGKYVTAAQAKPGDCIIMTKTAGLEGTAILASDKENQLKKTLGSTTLRKAKGRYDQISVVKDALTAFKAGGVHAMHDPTEGGVVGGVHELADASKLGFRIIEENVPIAGETLDVCRFFKIDPLCLIASGSLLISAKRSLTSNIIEALRRKRISASIIGEFLPSARKRTIRRKDGVEEDLARPVCDHLWIALEKCV